jgi:uncharacterized protein (TIGR03435 family)
MYTLIAECAIRAALIGAATALVLVALRVKMAAARHAAWSAVVLAMLILPLWTVWGPKAHLRVLPAPRVVSAVRIASAPLSFVALRASSEPAPPARGWSWQDAMAGVYLLGLAVLLARLTVGIVRARILVRQATDCEGVLTSSVCAAPITVGLLRPRVILPEDWRSWPQAQLDAVLAHEGAHATRHDPLIHALALLNRALFWFHPLAWWLERRLSVLAEEACDAAVIARGHDPRDYCQYLLHFARATQGRGRTIDALGTAMPGVFLGARIERILGGGAFPRISRARIAAMAMACTAVSVLFGAANMDRQLSSPPVPRTIASQTALPVTTAPQKAKVPVLVAQAEPQPRTSQVAPQQQQQLVAFYFDLDSMTEEDRARSADSAEKYVRTQLNQTASVAVMSVANESVKVLQDFTVDRNQAAEALHALPAATGGASNVERLAALETAMHMLGNLPQKKLLVYFGAGSPVTGLENDGPVRAATNAAIRANVAIYTIDARGLSAQQLALDIQQPRPAAQASAFDAISIKRAADGGQPALRTDPGMLNARNLSLKDLIGKAYQVRTFQVAGGPSWLASDRYDIVARTDKPATDAQLLAMLRDALATQFQLRLRHDSKEMRVWALTVAKGGPKLQPAKNEPEPQPNGPVRGVRMRGTVADFAPTLSILVNFSSRDNAEGPVGLSTIHEDVPVVDQTGLSGTYDFDLQRKEGQDIFGALEEQLGLKLESRKAPVEILTVEHAEKPAQQ